jgi:hypothetical protein
MEDRTKIRVGLILFTISVLIGLFALFDLTQPIFYFFIFLQPYNLIGLGFLYSGLSNVGKGMLLILYGILFNLLAIYVIWINIIWYDLITAFTIVNLIFWSLIFIVPGFLLIFVGGVNKAVLFLDGLVIFTFAGKAFVMLIWGAISQPQYFNEFYFENFWGCMGWGFLIGIFLDFLCFSEGFRDFMDSVSDLA